MYLSVKPFNLLLVSNAVDVLLNNGNIQVSYDDFVSAGSLVAAREKGLVSSVIML